MIELERKYFYTRMIWLFPLAFFFHIIEESRGFSNWVVETLGGDIDVQTFYWNNTFFMFVLLSLTLLTAYKRNRVSIFLLFLWVSGQQFWNFVFHIYTEWRFNAYSPGYFTAIFLYFPIYLYLSYIALRDKLISIFLWCICFFFGAFGMWFTIWAGLYHFKPFPWEKWL